MSRNYLLVANPFSKSGRNAGRIAEARRLMEQHGLRHTFLPTLPNGASAGEVAEKLKSGPFAAAVAMGGDGTFHDVAKGVVESGTGLPMGLIPAGTGNNQARSFHLPITEEDALDRAVRVIGDGATAPLDGGRIRIFGPLDTLLAEDWFFDSFGVGLSASVLRMRNQDRAMVEHVPLLGDIYRDELVYFGAALRSFMATWVEERFFDAVVTVDGKEVFLEDLSDLIINNTRYYARIWVPDPSGLPDDGLMELLAMRGRDEWLASVVTNLEEMPREPLEDLPLPRSVIYRGQRFSVELRDRPGGTTIESQLDGEEWLNISRLEVDVRRHALELIVPRAALT